MRHTVLYIVLAAAVLTLASKSDGEEPSGSAGSRVPLVFSAGHETDPRDRGRPVALVAGALGVSDEVFREAFSHVKPTKHGTPHDPEQIRKNKSALMQALGKHGVSNDWLDEVSGRYRYVKSRGEMWPTESALGYAEVVDGKVTNFVVTKGGFGYSSQPEVSVSGMPEVKATATISFSKDFEANGAVSAVKLAE